ncbi:MAG: hypothetical protein LBD04_08000 [Synergistaceae bacterium]|nr:hypothetical protein [Synergistaceae bacterium]
MKTKLNGRVSWLMALTAALGIVGAAALGPFFVTYEEHTCCGEGCPVCAQNKSSINGLGYFPPLLATPAFSTRVLLAYLPKLSAPKGMSTLVEAKVRLNE